MTTEPKANSFRSAVLSGKAGRHEDLVARSKKGRVDRSAEGLTGIAVPRQETRLQNQRGGDRHRLTGETASITIGRRKHTVELINVSGGGAMISGDLELKLWDPVDLLLGENGRVECVVRWIRGGRFGLEFAHETRLDCKAAEREAVLREVLTRNFGNVEFELPRSERILESRCRAGSRSGVRPAHRASPPVDLDRRASSRLSILADPRAKHLEHRGNDRMQYPGSCRDRAFARA